MIDERDRKITNALTGEIVTFLRTSEETAGELLVMEDRWQPGHPGWLHVHPSCEERREVISGLVQLTVGSEELIAGPRDVVVIPAGVPHSGGCEEPSVMSVEMRPALRWEDFLRQLFALAGEQLEGIEAERSVNELLREFAAEIALPA